MPPPFSVGHGPFKCSRSPFEGSCLSLTFQELTFFVLAIFWAYLRAPFASLCPMKVTQRWKSRRPYTSDPHWFVFYRCREWDSITILPDPAHTYTHKRTKTHTSKLECLILLYALQCCSSGLPCRALRVQSSPSVFRSDATVARSVRTHAHTPDGPWRTGCCRCFFPCVVLILPQMWAHLWLAVASWLPLCWQVSTSPLDTGQLPSATHTFTHTYTHSYSLTLTARK